MENKFLRLPEIMEVTGLARSTVYLWIKDGKFPQPIKLSPKLVVWKESDISDWIYKKSVEGEI